ncbi:hypothetical protein LR48_Vigan10g138600 [Vigna angularis]|uniref:TIR domain-containing protein n=1 Tax=Phaseolus angularis TaxID=3914 RepID=A0A0L9VL99_PHAAN|nr:hypothetical protein LR48_Vigan10g138600 [Vigna angularis]
MARRISLSLSSSHHTWIYDVFLNFRGEDTRFYFTDNLYHSLCQKGIHTFIDQEGLRKGEEITPALFHAIQNSRISIVVFSKNYASSTFCLNELVKILECAKEEGRSIYPIFYVVDPSEIRYQTGTYAEVLSKHEAKFHNDADNEKAKKWRKALQEAANLSGWHFQHGSGSEYEFIEKIVVEIFTKINYIPLYVPNNGIGLENAVQGGSDKIEFIKLEGYNNIQVQWNGKAFKEMKNLKILIIEDATFSTGPEHLPNSLRVLDWSCYPSPSLPPDFNPKRFEIILMPESCLLMFKPQKACLSTKAFILESLSVINLEDCKYLTDLPSLREASLLTTLRLDRCYNLVNIDESIGFLDKLSFLSAKHCTKLKTLAPCIMLTSLETLDLRKCVSLESFPEVLGKMDKIRTICLDHTAIDKLPFPIGNFVWLELLSLKGCVRLHQLPGSICMMPNVNMIIGYGHEGYNFFEKELRSEVSPMAMRIGGSNRYPKIVLCCCLYFPATKRVMIMTFNFRVFINDTLQFNGMCNSLFGEPEQILWCDLEGKVEGVFSEQEWNKAEIVFELDFPMRRNSRNENTTRIFDRGFLPWSLIGVYEEGNNKEDIQFQDPMSIFPLSNTEPPSSLPASLYYAVSRGIPEA